MTEAEIRQDERHRLAQVFLELIGKSGRAVQPGLWYAASLLDPRIAEGFNGN